LAATQLAADARIYSPSIELTLTKSGPRRKAMEIAMSRKTDKTTRGNDAVSKPTLFGRFNALCLCHRAIHGALAVAYFATLTGLDKRLVEAAIGSLYLALSLRG